MKTKNKNINLIKIICWIASILSFGYAIIILVSIISFTPISAQMDTPTTDTEYIRDDMRIYFENNHTNAIDYRRDNLSRARNRIPS